MANQDKWQAYELEDISEQKKLATEIKETRKILYGMRLYMHITSQSFVQSYRSFERNSYVHTSSTSDTAGIGFPHHYSHSYFYRVS